MKTRKRTEITRETSRLVVLRTSPGPNRSWCQACRAETEMISPETAAAILGVSTREIYRSIERGELHYLERSEAQLLICSTSLRRCHATRKTE